VLVSICDSTVCSHCLFTVHTFILVLAEFLHVPVLFFIFLCNLLVHKCQVSVVSVVADGL